MTIEEKIAFAKAMKESGATEIVLEKNVEYEIGKVESGGIGIQVIHSGMAAEKAVQEGASKPVKKKIVSPKLVDTCFTYRWLDDYPLGIVKLYQALLKGEFIAEDTRPDDFGKIFMGKDCGVKVKWIGKQAHLWYLFSLIFDRQYVEWPAGVGQWIIVQSHFVDKGSKVFLDFNSQHKPIKMEHALGVIADVLNPVGPQLDED